MSYNAIWVIKDRCVLVEFGESITFEDISAVNTDIITYLETGTAPVHVIFSVLNLKTFPVNIVEHARRLTYLSHEKLGWAQMCHTNQAVRFISAIINHTAKIKFRTPDSVDEALQFLYDTDDMLPRP